MRTLKELYQLVLNKINKNDYSCGICSQINFLHDMDTFTTEEWFSLKRHFIRNRPSLFSKFFWNENYSAFTDYWWTLDEKGMEQRKLFLQHLISKL